jgi:hypothetical protein
LDNLIRLLVFASGALLLLGANLWFVRTAYLAAKPAEFIIGPVAVIGAPGGDGTALAQMLQVRLKTLEALLIESQSSIRNAPSEPSSILSVPVNGHTAVVPLFKTVTIPTALLTAPNINVAVAGVQVTGVLATIESLLSRTRRLSFALAVGAEGRVTAMGDIAPLVSRGSGQLWIDTSATIVDAINELALGVLQKRYAQDGSSRLDSLTGDEFKSLVGAILRTGEINRRVVSGRVAEATAFKELFEAVSPLASRVPDWVELTHFAATLADRANARDQAITLYTAVVAAASQSTVSAELRALIASDAVRARIAELTTVRDVVGEGYELARPSPATTRAREAIVKAEEAATAHYRELFALDVEPPKLLLLEASDNAYWAPEQNFYVVPVGASTTPDVIYHEVAHPWVARYIGVDARGVETGAIVESYCDALSAWVKQSVQKQSAETADWEIGAGAWGWLTPDDKDPPRALRNMKTGLSEGRSGLISSYDRVKNGSEFDLAAVTNRSFYLLAEKVGTDAAIHVWHEALKELSSESAIRDLAAATKRAAERRLGANGRAITENAWRAVGVS